MTTDQSAAARDAIAADVLAATAPPVTPADVLASGYITYRGAVLDDDAAATVTEAFTECPDEPGAGAALRILAVYYAGRVLDQISAARHDGIIPADVLQWAGLGAGLTDYMISGGVPAPDCAATEALLGEIDDLVTRVLCAERAGLAGGALNRILCALETVEDNDDQDRDPAEADAISRLADRVADLAGRAVTGPGGKGFAIA